MRSRNRILSILAAMVTAALTFLMPVPSAQAAEPDPVLFVHGFNGAAWNWHDMIGEFEDAGYPSDRLHAMSYNPYQSNVTTASQIRDEVNALRARTGADKVDIVTHSMGGLGSRWYLKFLGGTDYVDDWVSLGGPNHGTNLAGLCSWVIPACGEMKSGSAFLTQLNGGDETPKGVNYGTFWSSCDEIINPDSSTLLSGAVNAAVGCIEHVWLVVSNSVSRATQDFIR